MTGRFCLTSVPRLLINSCKPQATSFVGSTNFVEVVPSLEPVVRKVNSAVHRMVIFSNFLKCSITGETLIKVPYFRIKVNFYPRRVQDLRCLCFLCLSVAFVKISLSHG